MSSRLFSDARYRDFERPGKSEAFGTNGMVATSHPQASLAALDVLRRGGNAFDAAVCAAAVQAVVEPTQTGIGGDCFVLFQKNGASEPAALNGSGWAPAHVDAEVVRAEGEVIGGQSVHSVTVPGALAAWERLIEDHGTLDFAELLAPAIALAEQGCCVPERLARDWARQVSKLEGNAAAASIFLKDGRTPRPGDIHRQPLLARTLKMVAAQGTSAFYLGDIAEAMVSTLRVAGGSHVLDDFAEYEPEYVTPISCDYRGYRLWECPPSGQGLAVMTMARILEGFPLSEWPADGAARLHLQAEAARIAYAERDIFMADPRFGPVPVDELLSDTHIGNLRNGIDAARRMDDVARYTLPPHKDTVFISVVDRDRNVVSFINSIFDDFGSGIACEKSGVIFHNRGCSFSLEEGHPNVLSGRKRPMHTIIPALLSKDGKPALSFGVTGAHFQPVGQIQVLTNIVDYGMSVQAAIDYPRMFAINETFEVESAIREDVCEELRKLGHVVTRPVNPLGTAQAIFVDHMRGILRGGADGRRDGLALGY